MFSLLNRFSGVGKIVRQVRPCVSRWNTVTLNLAKRQRGTNYSRVLKPHGITIHQCPLSASYQECQSVDGLQLRWITSLYVIRRVCCAPFAVWKWVNAMLLFSTMSGWRTFQLRLVLSELLRTTLYLANFRLINEYDTLSLVRARLQTGLPHKLAFSSFIFRAASRIPRPLRSSIRKTPTSYRAENYLKYHRRWSCR